MKKWTIVGIIMMTFSSCSAQNTESEKQLASLYKQVKYRNQAVTYNLNIQIGACNFELLINDMPVQEYFGDADGTANVSVPINDAILTSGKQHWKLIVYPGERKGQVLTALSPNVLINIELEKTTESDHNKKSDKPVKLISTPVNTANGSSVYADAGKKTAMYEGTFDAVVPYTLKGWTMGQDLRKEDQVRLEQEVLKYYQKYAGFYHEKNIAGILSAVMAKERERAQYFFLDQVACKETVTGYKEFLDFPSSKVLPINQYQMRIYGGGKVVALERTDRPNKGEPVTRIEYKDKNGKTVTEFMYVYLQRNTSGELEMIR